MSALIRQKLIGNVWMTARLFCSKPEIPRNALEDLVSGQHQTKPGAVYDKKPFRIDLVAGK